MVAINIVLVTVLGGLYFLLPSGTPIKKIDGEVQPSRAIEFENMLRAELGEDVPRFAVFFFRPGIDQEPIVFQSRPMRPASMIKVFVMAKAMLEVKNGSLSLDEPLMLTSENIVGGAGSIAGEGVGALIPARKLIDLMIVESDNTATNTLIDRLGMAELNQYLRDNGYVDTVINHKMMLDGGVATNLSSVRDLGLIFTRIYNHECVDEAHDMLMLDYLLRQEDTDCFPNVLPYWNIAHKTGEVEGLYDDGGIFYGSTGDFILVIMNDDIDGREEAIEKMQSIAFNAALTIR